MIDYVLTAAVTYGRRWGVCFSFPDLWPYKVWLSLFFLGLITLANLRGLRESGTVMAIPVYFFLVSYLGMLAIGVVKALMSEPGSFEDTASSGGETVTTLLLLHTFASGCTALTGIEAISNGVPAFKPPQTDNARRTLVIMALLMGTLFVGSNGLTQYFAVVARSVRYLSALARRILGSGVFYAAVQTATLLVLVVATNTSFADFPRLASILARDGYAPRQFAMLGDRLVFSTGMLALALLTGLLIVAFSGDTHALISLFAVGVFLAFTLSQAGMVVHWISAAQSWLADQSRDQTDGCSRPRRSVADCRGV